MWWVPVVLAEYTADGLPVVAKLSTVYKPLLSRNGMIIDLVTELLLQIAAMG